MTGKPLDSEVKVAGVVLPELLTTTELPETMIWPSEFVVVTGPTTTEGAALLLVDELVTKLLLPSTGMLVSLLEVEPSEELLDDTETGLVLLLVGESMMVLLEAEDDVIMLVGIVERPVPAVSVGRTGADEVD